MPFEHQNKMTVTKELEEAENCFQMPTSAEKFGRKSESWPKVGRKLAKFWPFVESNRNTKKKQFLHRQYSKFCKYNLKIANEEARNKVKENRKLIESKLELL